MPRSFTISDTHLAAFSAQQSKRFEDDMLAYLQAEYPEKCQKMGEPWVRELIQMGIDKAKGYDLVLEDDVARFIEMLAAISPSFDEEGSATPWANGILTRRRTPGRDKINALYGHLAFSEDAVAAETTPGASSGTPSAAARGQPGLPAAGSTAARRPGPSGRYRRDGVAPAMPAAASVSRTGTPAPPATATTRPPGAVQPSSATSRQSGVAPTTASASRQPPGGPTDDVADSTSGPRPAPVPPRPLRAAAASAADERLVAEKPDTAGRPLTMQWQDAEARRRWVELYREAEESL